ncbi:MAG TPA: 8-amino-7-oxononanoate synthase [Candidatus Binataceae bacterium]|nr:8-amino-7-oxononanoate synthase [Candidatus Binataceae bacterium]
MSFLDNELRATLARLELDGLRRSLRVIASEHGPRVTYGGRSLIMLSSNNYLGLAAHPALKRAAINAMERYGVGAGASRLVAGSLEPIHRLEENLAAFKQVEAALVFGSGYLASLGALTALAGPGDVIFSDELNHASLIDGCRLTRAEIRVYRHCDSDHLRSLLEQPRPAGRRLIVTDSIFSMDGDFAPLHQIVAVAREFEAAIVLDEAHAVGVIGPGGAGLAAEFGVEKEIDVHLGTLSKALGAYGAYIAGSQVLIDFLINRSRSFIYTTGLPPAIAAAADAALEVTRAEPERIKRLWDNASYLRDRLTAAGFGFGPTRSPILPLIIGEAQAAVAMAQRLFERGVYVIAIRPPTVPPGTARLRITPIADHSRGDLDAAIAAMVQSGRELRLIPS